jgi:hypothetical protein
MPNNTPSSLETGGNLSGDGFSNPKERIFNLLAQLKNPGQRKERQTQPMVPALAFRADRVNL